MTTMTLNGNASNADWFTAEKLWKDLGLTPSAYTAFQRGQAMARQRIVTELQTILGNTNEYFEVRVAAAQEYLERLES